jgi:hypothetical protein
MNLRMNMQTRICARPQRAVALVITLLMLSVITFLAIAFLAMTTRDKNAVNATVDLDTAKTMSEAAQARAQTEIIAQMMSAADILNYDYRASHNYINTNGFDPALGTYFTNVNYDYLTGVGAYNAQTKPVEWAENIYNLYYDPRPPVFINTNPATPPDFRYWVDLNRNGMFESNGYVRMLTNVPNTPVVVNGSWVSNLVNGEPEWIGVLKYPWTNHSFTNLFIGRYAYLVLPIGKTLDLNFIHNHSTAPGQKNFGAPLNRGYFNRDEGVGSWELNLAAALDVLNTNIYQAPSVAQYNYVPLGSFDTGLCFYDADQLLNFRYSGNLGAQIYPQTLTNALNPPLPMLKIIDEYGAFPSVAAPFDYNLYSSAHPNPTQKSWPGSYNTNMFYDVQDIFDATKTGSSFVTSWLAANKQGDSDNRYSFQRLLSSIGTSSTPEYGVYVYQNGMTNAGPGAPPTVLRTKVNINFDNSDQIAAGPNSPMSTNLIDWTPLGFFTNAADLMLSSQEFPVTNLVGGLMYYNHFGLANGGIPIYNSTNASFCYNAKIHRTLQVAANIYEATAGKYSSNVIPYASGQTVYLPHAYRPLFYISNSPLALTVNIVGYAPVAPFSKEPAFGYPFIDLSNTNALKTYAGQTAPNINIWGVPWVVGTVTGLPSFNKYTYQNRVIAQRELLFVRGASGGKAITNVQPQYTNQFYVFTVSNQFGIDAWCPYSSGYPRSVILFETNFITVVLTNNFNKQYTNNFQFGTNIPFNSWPRWTGNTNNPTGFIALLQTNVTSITNMYFSDVNKTFLPFANILAVSNAYPSGPLTPDFMQSTFPVHNWTLYITNHVYYYLYDQLTGRLLDFVNLGPFVSTNGVLPGPATPVIAQNPWLTNNANDLGGFSTGLQNQIQAGYQVTPQLYDSLNPKSPNGGSHFSDSVYIFGAGVNSSNMFDQTTTFVANDPLVHYTIDDLTWPANVLTTPRQLTLAAQLNLQLSNDVGQIKRYDPWPGNGNLAGQMLFRDPGVTKPDDWQFPTNDLPSVGWLGRIHRGTPWQTIYLKSDNPNGNAQNVFFWGGVPTQWAYNELPNYAPYNPGYFYQTNNAGYATNAPAQGTGAYWVNTVDTYPTRDWPLVDLFTAAPNDNAMRGLLSVNQTNTAAWAAVFAGVIALTNPPTGVTGITIDPTNIASLVDNTNAGSFGINATRTSFPNQLFHHVGDILSTPALTVASPFVGNTGIVTDEMVERIPQQTLGLLKVGLPQFVIYSWGQSLKPKNLYQGGGPTYLANICTNYEITGEYLTRTVCHIKPGDPTAAAPQIVVDSFNIEPGN